jgi:hypothetical protein
LTVPSLSGKRITQHLRLKNNNSIRYPVSSI